MTARAHQVDERVVDAFLAGGRIAVVGASSDRRSFGNAVFRALRSRGYDVVPVNPFAAEVEGVAAAARVPAGIDGAIVMVGHDKAVDVVRDCLDQGVGRVWLFKGLGAPGSVNDEAIELCRARGVEVVPGACPMMFLPGAGWGHRLHRAARRRNGSLARVEVRGA